MDNLNLKNYGIDYEAGLVRCIGDKMLYNEILKMFLDDSSLEKAEVAVNNKEYDEVFKYMHELKGVSGNLELVELYSLVCKLTELVRNSVTEEDKVVKEFNKVKLAYVKAKEGIKLITD